MWCWSIVVFAGNAIGIMLTHDHDENLSLFPHRIFHIPASACALKLWSWRRHSVLDPIHNIASTVKSKAFCSGHYANSVFYSRDFHRESFWHKVDILAAQFGLYSCANLSRTAHFLNRNCTPKNATLFYSVKTWERCSPPRYRWNSATSQRLKFERDARSLQIPLGPSRHNKVVRVALVVTSSRAAQHARHSTIPTFSCTEMHELDSVSCRAVTRRAKWNSGLSSPCMLAEEKVVTCSVARVGQHGATRTSRQRRQARICRAFRDVTWRAKQNFVSWAFRYRRLQHEKWRLDRSTSEVDCQSYDDQPLASRGAYRHHSTGATNPRSRIGGGQTPGIAHIPWWGLVRDCQSGRHIANWATFWSRWQPKTGLWRLYGTGAFSAATFAAL